MWYMYFAILYECFRSNKNHKTECIWRVCHVGKARTRENHLPNWGAKIRGEGGVIALWYISLTGGKKHAQFRMKVVSDVLLLLCLHDFGLWVTAEAGQALACLYSGARLYKGPGQANLSQSAATRSTGNISVRIQKVDHSNTRGIVSSLFFSRSK